ncbi:MAG: hypothetical protein AB1531_09195 [Chloroflexota bacterium]
MKKVWIVLAAGLMIACMCPGLPVFTPTQPHVDPTSQEPLVTGSLTVLRLQPSGGDLTTQLQAEARNAAALGQHMFVEFDAEW